MSRAFREAGKEAQKQLRAANLAAAQVVVDEAKGRTPVRTGRAQRSLRATAQQKGASVVGGGAKVPYFGKLDYGSNDSKKRPFLRGGRIVYPALEAKRDQVVEVYGDALDDAMKAAGFQP